MLIIREYDVYTLLHFKMTLVHSLYFYASPGKRTYASDFQPFSSHGTHKLITKILQHTKKKKFLASLTKKEV